MINSQENKGTIQQGEKESHRQVVKRLLKTYLGREVCGKEVSRFIDAMELSCIDVKVKKIK